MELASSVGRLELLAGEDAEGSEGWRVQLAVEMLAEVAALRDAQAALRTGSGPPVERVPILVHVPGLTEAERASLPAFPASEVSGGHVNGEMVAISINGDAGTVEMLEALNKQDREAAYARQEAKRALFRERWAQVEAELRLAHRVQRSLELDGPSGIFELDVREVARLAESRGDSVETAKVDLGDADDGMVTTLQTTGLSSVAFPNGWRGDGIGIWVNDNTGSVIDDAIGPSCSYSMANLVNVDIDPDADEQHASNVVCTLVATAPDATVYFADKTVGCNLRTDVPSLASGDPIYVSSISNAYGDGKNADYGPCERDWDDFVRDTKVAHFALTHNQAGYVRGAAQAYNVISVGAFIDRSIPFVMRPTSNWKDPETGADKPEIVAPGEALLLGTHSITGAQNLFSGTSAATPVAAGFAASLMEAMPALKGRPHLVKAMLMSGAVDVDPANGWRDGQGGVNFGLTAYTNWYVTWNEKATTQVFTTDADGDGKPDHVRTYSLTAGKTYRFLLSWLTNGAHALVLNSPSLTVSLRVTTPGGTTFSSNKADNSYQMVEFVAPQSGIYTVQLEQMYYSGLDNVNMALVVNW